MKMNSLQMSVAAIAVVAALGGAYSLGQYAPLTSAHAAPQPAATSAVANTAPINIPNGLPDMRSIVANNAQAVVNISVTGTRKTAANLPDLQQMDPNDPFYRFFRHFRGQMPEGNQPLHGLGSGFIVTPD